MDLGLYVITASIPELGRDHYDVAAAAVEGGATAIQLRIKRRSMGEVLKIATRIHELTQEAGIPLIINDHVGIAMASKAEGLHVGQDDMPVPAALRMIGRGRIVGKSVSNHTEALKAVQEGATYVGVGAVYATAIKPDQLPTGPQRIAKIRALSNIPIIAIGGVDAGNLGECVEAGANGVAVLSAVAMADDMVAATTDLRRALDDARSSLVVEAGAKKAG